MYNVDPILKHNERGYSALVLYVERLKKEIESCGDLWPPLAAWWSFLSSFSTGRVLTGLRGLTQFLAWKQKRGLEWGGVCSDAPPGTALFRPAAAPAGPGMRLPIPGTGGRCRPVITDDIHEVVFQIVFPVLPAASGANSTGRITQVAARLRECGLYKHSTNKKVKRHTALLLRASERGKWGYVLREGPTFPNTPTDSTITCQSNQKLFTLW